MFDDKHFQKEAEGSRIAAGDHLRKAAEADGLGQPGKAEYWRDLATRSTRRAELYERIIGRWEFGGGKLELTSIDVEDAHKLLDRFDRNPIDDVLTRKAGDSITEGRLEIIQGKACAWAFGNAVRAGALDEIVRMIQLIERDGVEVNLAALARMTGISRQTLHARLGPARAAE
ncbi:hypothetical protein ACFRAO_00205 [Streptomyces sp. NPDC056656]|uniref:hypothetical protein n=1 Tax=Streptomyces sp. NPDC056656 TaxID=3345895 RepID=UPI0036827638